MARSAKKAAVSQPQAPTIERPPQPQRFKADKEQLLQFYRNMLLIRRFEERAQLKHRSQLLDPRKADPDMADELVRKDLGLVRPDEVIVPLD